MGLCLQKKAKKAVLRSEKYFSIPKVLNYSRHKEEGNTHVFQTIFVLQKNKYINSLRTKKCFVQKLVNFLLFRWPVHTKKGKNNFISSNFFFLQISFLKNAFSLLKRFYFRPVIFNISRSYAQRGRQKPRFSNNYGLAENINKLPFRYRKCVFLHKNWLFGGRNFFLVHFLKKSISLACAHRKRKKKCFSQDFLLAKKSKKKNAFCSQKIFFSSRVSKNLRF